MNSLMVEHEFVLIIRNQGRTVQRPFSFTCGVVAVIARWAHNPKVVGLIPTPATI